MKAVRLKSGAWISGAVCGLLLGLSAGTALAQSPARSTLHTRTVVSNIVHTDLLQPDPDPRAQVWGRPVVRVGQDYVLRATDTVRQVLVVFGGAEIDGYVDGDVIVWLGPVQLSTTAVVRGSLVVIGGRATIASGAVVRGDLVVVGGDLDTPVGFAPGREHVVIGAADLGDRMRSVLPWVTRGLLWGRPIVPDLKWVWYALGIFFVVYLMVNLVLHHPVRACAETLSRKPLSTMLAGVLVLLLAVPLVVMLTLTVIGLPIAVCGLILGGVVGKVGVARWIGGSLVPETDAESRVQGMRSFVIGFVLIGLLYMVPVVGLVAWTLFGVLGLGAAMLTFFSALRRENPAPARVTPVAPPPLVHAPSYPEPPPYPSAAASARSESAFVSEPVATASEPPSAAAAAAADAPSPAPPPPSRRAPMPAGAAVAGADLTVFPHAGFPDRLAAFALDAFLVFIIDQALDLTRHNSQFIAMLVVYHVGFWTWKATTVGGIICNLRVTRTDGAPLGFADALVRGLSGIFSLAAFGLGGLWILKDPEKQAWHDRIAGTFVVKVPRDWPM